MTASTPIIFVTYIYALIARCHTFEQVKRRFAPARSFPIDHLGPFTNYHFTLRGGDISSGREEIGGTFSQFIESFESELSEIRREAEIEAEIEMQKLLGLVDRTGKMYDDDMEETPDDNEEIDTYDELLEDVNDDVQHEEDVKDSTTEEVDESELSVNEQDTPSESMMEEGMSESLQQDEDDTYDLDEQDAMPLSASDVAEVIDTGEEEVKLAISEDNNVESDLKTGISVENIETEIKPKKKRKSKSKKTIATKSSKAGTMRSSSELIDQHSIDGDACTTSSVSIPKEKPIQSRGLRHYTQTDLVRAVFLFIATVVISIWLQRVQRQMEAQGI
jgi:hypothetical protein